MNIYGIGTDIVNVKRINAVIKKNGPNFKKRIYTDFEIKTCEKRKNKAECYAKRFAAKEALYKAVGIKKILQFTDVEIQNDSQGAPKFLIRGISLIKLRKFFKKKRFDIKLSLSDDKPWAVATAIIFIKNK